MPDETQTPKPETLDELAEQLDQDDQKELPSTHGVAAEPPNPRATTSKYTRPHEPAEQSSDISDDDLKAVASAVEDPDDPDEPTTQLQTKKLHIESDPNAPRPRFWKRKKFWAMIIFLVVMALASAWFIRPSRLYIVNALGLRANLAVEVNALSANGQVATPIKKAAVSVNGASFETSDAGTLAAKITYGETTVSVKKAGYEDAKKTVMIDFDPFFYTLGGKQQDDAARDIKLGLKNIGLPLSFIAKDWLTGHPLTTGTFSVDNVKATPNDQGVVNLVLPPGDIKTAKVASALDGKYLDKEFEIALDTPQTSVDFVPAGQEYFISKRSGAPAVYSSYLDGSNVAEIVPASAQETSTMALAISPSAKYGMLATTRNNQRDSQGALLQQLYRIDLATKKMQLVDQAQWFNFVDWQADTLVYTASERRAQAAANSQRLACVDAASAKKVDLGTANAYGAVRVARDSVMYQVIYASTDANFSNSPDLRVVLLKGGTEKNLGYKVQKLAQTDVDRFAYQTADGAWHEYNANTVQVKNTPAPANPGRVFLTTPTADGQNRIVVDKVDGKTTLILKNVGNGQEKTLYSAASITGPIRTVGDVVIFRQADGIQTADFAISLSGGAPKKIVDVTATVPAFTPHNDYFVFF